MLWEDQDARNRQVKNMESAQRNTKPRIRKIGKCWFCDGVGGISPRHAYYVWNYYRGGAMPLARGIDVC